MSRSSSPTDAKSSGLHTSPCASATSSGKSSANIKHRTATSVNRQPMVVRKKKKFLLLTDSLSRLDVSAIHGVISDAGVRARRRRWTEEQTNKQKFQHKISLHRVIWSRLLPARDVVAKGYRISSRCVSGIEMWRHTRLAILLPSYDTARACILSQGLVLLKLGHLLSYLFGLTRTRRKTNQGRPGQSGPLEKCAKK